MPSASSPIRAAVRVLPAVLTAAQTAPPTSGSPGAHRTRLLETSPPPAPSLRLDGGITAILTMLVQAQGLVTLERRPSSDVFVLPNARLTVRGALGPRFAYTLRSDLARSPAILDAEVAWTPSTEVRVSAGRFKTPFSGEWLTPVAAIDFASRACAVVALIPGRRDGVQVDAGLPGGIVRVRGGLFDARGTGGAGGSRGRLLGAGRLVATTPDGRDVDGRCATVGFNAVVEDGPVTINGGSLVATGVRTLLGADARVRLGRVLVAGEVLHEQARDAKRHGSLARDGLYATLGYDVRDNARVLARLDRFDDSDGLVQANAALPLDAAGRTRAGLTLATQVSF